MLVLAAALAACGGNGDCHAGIGADAEEADVAAYDANGVDATVNDAGEADGAGHDAGGVDAAMYDAGEADGAVHDAGEFPPDVIGPTITTFVPSGPIRLTSDMTIEGLHITSTTGPCIWGLNVRGVRITNNRIGPCGPGEDGTGVALERASDVRIDHNFFDDVATAYYPALDGDNHVFDHNYAQRIRGPRARGQLVQFNQVRGSGHRIVCNISDQTTPGYLDGPEDHISMFASSGTAESPVFIAYNKLRGGGPSRSGGGALAGDWGGSYITIQRNILVNPGQYGLAIAGGTHHKILDNLVYSPDSFEWSNVGMVMWGQGNTTDPSTCYGHEVRGNRVLYRHRDGYLNGAWNAGNCGPVAGWEEDNDFNDQTLTAAIWDLEFPECQ
jgi:hypothetical protein